MGAHAGAVHDLNQINDAGNLDAGQLVDAVHLGGLHQLAGCDSQGTGLIRLDGHAVGLRESVSSSLLSGVLGGGVAGHGSASASGDLGAQGLTGLGGLLDGLHLIQQGAGFGLQRGQGVAFGGVDLGVDGGQSGLDFRNAIHVKFLLKY